MPELAAHWTHSVDVATVTLPALGGALSTLIAFRNCTLSSGSTAELRVNNRPGPTIEVVSPDGARYVGSPGRVHSMQVIATGGAQFTGGSIVVWTVDEPMFPPGASTADSTRVTADTTIITADAT